MVESVTLFILSLILIPVGIMNYKGDISSIHWYNRRKVSESDRPSYGKAMGIATLTISGGLFITALLGLFFTSELIFIPLIVVVSLGGILILWAQFKYNKGLF